jgi:hypothetical protein
MSRTRRANDYIRKSCWTNVHHCINQSCWWRDVDDNRIELKINTHNDIHKLFGNQLPHEIIETLLNTICKPFTDELKKDLFNVLSKHKDREYKPDTYQWKNPRHWNYYSRWELFIY